MEWLKGNVIALLGVLFGAGSVGYLLVSKIIDRKKFNQEVRTAASEADIKGDEFWKKRYDVLENENKQKDEWWQARYNNLSTELNSEKGLTNEIIRSFRNELNEIRKEYESQKEYEQKKYKKLREDYDRLEKESEEKINSQLKRISQLEDMIDDYLMKICNNVNCSKRNNDENV